MKKLSRENFNKLNENFLYKKAPEPGQEHSRNWTYKCVKNEIRGTASMLETSLTGVEILEMVMPSTEVTDENINEFEKVFDFSEVKQICEFQVDEYDEKDVIHIPTCTKRWREECWWIKNGTEKSTDKLIKKTRGLIERYGKAFKANTDYLIKLLKEKGEEKMEGIIGQQQIDELKDVIVILQQIDSKLFFEEIANIQEKVSKLEKQ
ncbi:MAG: hypothetical protein APF81_19280 [Desulfosporosinus sp. BRH_c37]|nr:MAG: hypothetical protein APF81_19280 [Desulfosporosinus sp. BRH_c37]